MSPFLALELSPQVADERLADWIRAHLPFLHPSRSKAEPGGTLAAAESSLCKGRISTLPRIPAPVELFSGPHSCAHDLLLGGRSPVRAWRAKGPDGRWHPLTVLALTRGKTSTLAQIRLMEPAWSPGWDCPPLRRNDEENWATLIEGFKGIAQEAGRSLRAAIVDRAAFQRAAREGIPNLRQG